MNEKQKEQIIVSAVVLILSIFAIYSLFNSTKGWFYTQIGGIGGILIFYKFLYKRFNMNPALLALYGFALIVHEAGTFDFYTKYFFGLRYDHYTHFIGAFAISVGAYNYLHKEYKVLEKDVLIFLSFFTAMGISAFYEIAEFIGLYYFDTITRLGYIDTVQDLISNTGGAFLGTLLMWLNGGVFITAQHRHKNIINLKREQTKDEN